MAATAPASFSVARRTCELIALGEPAGIQSFRFAWLKQRQVDRVAHRQVTGVVRVQVVARIELRLELLRQRRIPRRQVEIDQTAVRPGRASPLVQRLPPGFPFWFFMIFSQSTGSNTWIAAFTTKFFTRSR